MQFCYYDKSEYVIIIGENTIHSNHSIQLFLYSGTFKMKVKSKS